MRPRAIRASTHSQTIASQWTAQVVVNVQCLTNERRTFADRSRRDEQVKERISQKLVESGEKERLKELLRQKLIECGWRDEMKTHCKGALVNAVVCLVCRLVPCCVTHCSLSMRNACWMQTEVIRNKGIDQVTVEDLVEEITPRGQGTLPQPSQLLWVVTWNSLTSMRILVRCRIRPRVREDRHAGEDQGVHRQVRIKGPQAIPLFSSLPRKLRLYKAAWKPVRTTIGAQQPPLHRRRCLSSLSLFAHISNYWVKNTLILLSTLFLPLSFYHLTSCFTTSTLK